MHFDKGIQVNSSTIIYFTSELKNEKGETRTMLIKSAGIFFYISILSFLPFHHSAP